MQNRAEPRHLTDARRLGLALIAVASMGHFGDCGHELVGGENRAEAPVKVAEGDKSKRVVHVEVDAPECAEVTQTVFVATPNGLEVFSFDCDGPCVWAQDVEIAGPADGTVEVDVRAECEGCGDDTLLVTVSVK